MADRPNLRDEAPERPASEDEERAAAELREALDDPRRAHPDAEWARAIALAHDPRPLDEREHARILEAALARTPRSNVRRGPWLAALVPIAAGIALVAFARDGFESRTVETVKLVPSRSTESLFDRPFAAGEASARIDRIAQSRAADFRENRFRQWGVR